MQVVNTQNGKESIRVAVITPPTIQIVVVEVANQARTEMTAEQAQELVIALQQMIAGVT